ncbi:DUF72 domain-containing protein [Desulfovirgula thermocuniculi]|uniref:DUF72 domain-containing protein n=1 Tax=Desulfovirgula thermocuniculi TaxID=348842 RepID=UPI0003F8F363|nr:DUF72 domain-containing protein [Desulfovirgula thermocuniculi]
MATGGLYIGTSGYNYPHWRERFYPPEMPARAWLGFYAEHFNTVELNVTFYRQVQPRTFEKWHETTPPDFRFALKGHRFITHLRRLSDVGEAVASFFRCAAHLEEKLAVVLWQFPPSFQSDEALLAAFCALLREIPPAARTRHAFEFRHRSWFAPPTYRILAAGNFALCIGDSPRWPQAEEITADFVYLRFHGGKQLYRSNYSTAELGTWARRIEGWLGQGLDVYAYFNNDAEGHALHNAAELRALVGRP